MHLERVDERVDGGESIRLKPGWNVLDGFGNFTLMQVDIVLDP